MELTKYRKLRPLSQTPKRSRTFYVFDTETGKVFSNGKIEYSFGARPEKLLFGVVYSENYCKVLLRPEDFKKEFMHARYRNKIVYAHNAEYDLTAVFDNIYTFDPEAIFNGKFICMTNGNCTFADSYNLLQGSVKEIGKMLGLNKEQLGDANRVSHIDNLKSDVHYCRRDCEIVYNALVKLFENNEPALTIGSLALKLFRRNFLKEAIKIHPFSDEFFKAYYGGRTEAFYIGKCDAEVFDINSAYPYAGVKAKFIDPCNLLKTKDANEIELILNDPQYEGMITATIFYPDVHIPILPVRGDGKLIFPTGKFSGAWTLIEFRYAISTHKIKILGLGFCIYSKGIESPIKEFMLHYYKERQKSNDLLHRYNTKLFMNNLTGKFAQQKKTKCVYVEHDRDIAKTMKRLKIKDCEIVEVNKGYFIQYETALSIPHHSIAPWAAQITAFTRVHLHKFMNQKPKAILYCDTDSIFAQKFKPMGIGTALGQWKKEDYNITRIRGPKDYEMNDGKRKLKGVTKNAHEISDNIFEFMRMIKTKESFNLKSGIPAGTFVKHTKVISGIYTKRKLKKDGTTNPLKLKDE